MTLAASGDYNRPVVAITHPQLRRLEKSLGANPDASQVRRFRATVMQHLRDEEREERSMARKKMTEAEKKAWKAKMDAAKRRKRGPTLASTIKALGGSKSRPPRTRSGGARGTTAITLVKSGDGSYSVPLLPSGSPSSSSIVLASQGALASVKRGSGLAIRKAREVLEGVLEEPKKKKTRRKPAKKAEVVKKPKRRRSGLTGDIRKGKPAKPKKPKKPKTRRAKSGSAPKRKAMSARARLVCYPIGSGSDALLMSGRKTKRKTRRKAAPKKAAPKKAAPKKTTRKAKKPGRRKASKPSAALATMRGEFVFPHAPGSRRSCLKCGRLHSKREHWSHKLMHGTKPTKFSYECARGGKCVFDRLTAKKEKAEAIRIQAQNTTNPRRQAELAMQYYRLIGRAGRR